MITYFFIFCVSDFAVVNHGKGTFERTMLFFCMGLGLIAAKTMSEALTFRPKSVLGYAIDNKITTYLKPMDGVEYVSLHIRPWTIRC
jgi:hypothetical protein